MQATSEQNSRDSGEWWRCLGSISSLFRNKQFDKALFQSSIESKAGFWQLPAPLVSMNPQNRCYGDGSEFHASHK